MVPSNLKFTKDHEWIQEKGERIILGITEYAQEELGDVVYVDLPAEGEKVKAKSAIASIESVKAVSEIYAPLSGEVVKVNDELQHSPELINQDPYGKGWIAEIEVSEASELKTLLTAAEYQKLIGEK